MSDPERTAAPVDYAPVRAAYDTVADDYAARLPDTRAEAPLDLAMLDHFAATVSASGAGAVLDAGCGAGRISRYLADRGCAVTGVDLSPGMVAAAQRAHADIAFTVGSIADLPYPDDSFDGVLLWYSTIHTPPEQLGPVFREAARVLRSGGHLLVAFQSGSGTRDVSPAYRRLGHDVELHRYLTTADEVVPLLEAVGMSETCRLVRSAHGHEADQQTVLLARAG
ncbi:Methyltransferase domain-containing protein [Quadrisphaera granulorum]|uniref:Methyltransferase family protein n=1 Tax=Quadrisphaera granulorum TaxID=317664 RepID=A0A315ZFX7_9ACTN|nr:class I SAM-dependent methyltransferase [Quadrisphaera granulorum]PWJ43654.1 methyltransferase family protein [Quadrisphaera granulorum]SZE99210.1 Methyltransferase domain-containing protein [Quadrisphaera granulorum]